MILISQLFFVLSILVLIIVSVLFLESKFEKAEQNE